MCNGVRCTGSTNCPGAPDTSPHTSPSPPLCRSRSTEIRFVQHLLKRVFSSPGGVSSGQQLRLEHSDGGVIVSGSCSLQSNQGGGRRARRIVAGGAAPRQYRGLIPKAAKMPRAVGKGWPVASWTARTTVIHALSLPAHSSRTTTPSRQVLPL